MPKAQRRFRRLLDDIAATRADIDAWRAYIDAYRQRVIDEIQPLEARMRQAEIRVLLALDRAFEGPHLTRSERNTASDIIVELTARLLDDEYDETLELLHDAHSAVPYAERGALNAQRKRRRRKADANSEPASGNSDDADNPAQDDSVRTGESAQDRADDGAQPRGRRARDPGTEDASPAQADPLDAAASARGTVRALYRRLVSALHPDREADPDARAAKTALMQRLTRAYDAQDLATLLDIAASQPDAIDPTTFPPTQLRHFNAQLAAQLAQLDAERSELSAPFRRVLGGTPAVTLDRHDIDRAFAREAAQLKRIARAAENEARMLREVGVLKAWLAGRGRAVR